MPIKNQSIAQLFEDFNINKKVALPSVQKILEDVFVQVLEDRYYTDDEDVIRKAIEITVNPNNCDFEILTTCEVVANEDKNVSHIDKISISYAKEFNKDITVGETIAIKRSLASLVGRRNVIEIRHILIEKVRDLVYNELYEKYKKIAAEVNTGSPSHDKEKEILILAALL